MSARLSILGTVIAAAAGAALWASQVPALRESGEMAYRPNPLGLKKSPYGEVIAIAMQGPVDNAFVSGIIGRRIYKAEAAPAETAQVSKDAGPLRRFRIFLDDLNSIAELRTNPKSASEAHQFYIRRRIEDRLKFAYEFDPSNYANYNSYHFFITQPQLGTRPVLTPKALDLAQETIRYSLAREDDPRPALTAAAAAENMLQLMFERPKGYTTAQMRHLLGIMDLGLARYRQIDHEWVQNGTWEELSSLRQAEAEERHRFTIRLREAAEGAIRRLENETTSQAVR